MSTVLERIPVGTFVWLRGNQRPSFIPDIELVQSTMNAITFHSDSNGLDFSAYRLSPTASNVGLTIEQPNEDPVTYNLSLERRQLDRQGDTALPCLEIYTDTLGIYEVKKMIFIANLPRMKTLGMLDPLFAEATINLSLAVERLLEGQKRASSGGFNERDLTQELRKSLQN